MVMEIGTHGIPVRNPTHRIARFVYRVFIISLLPHFTEMPSRRSASKQTTKTAAVSEAQPQRAAKNIRKESPDVPDKRQVATSRTKPKRHKRVALLVSTFINNISFLNLDRLLLFSVCSNWWRRRDCLSRKLRG